VIDDPNADPFVPTIIESLRLRGHLPAHPLREVHAWDRAVRILRVVTAEQVFDAWQEIKKTRECDPTDPVLPLLVNDFKAKLAAWLAS
jgi:hypothetical protein